MRWQAERTRDDMIPDGEIRNIFRRCSISVAESALRTGFRAADYWRYAVGAIGNDASRSVSLLSTMSHGPCDRPVRPNGPQSRVAQLRMRRGRDENQSTI